MQHFDYVLLAYGSACFILASSTWLICKREQKTCSLVKKIIAE